MKFEECKIHGIRLNRLYFNYMKTENGKKHGCRYCTDFYWCKKCIKIYYIKEMNTTEIIPLEIKN